MDLYQLAKKFQADVLKGEQAAAGRLAVVLVSIEKSLTNEIEALAVHPSKPTGRIQHLLKVRDSIRAQAKKIPGLAGLLAGPVNMLGPSLAEKHVQEAAMLQLGPKYAAAIKIPGIGDTKAGPGANVQTATALSSTPALQNLFQSVAGDLSQGIEEAFSLHMAKGSGTEALARELRDKFQTAALRSRTIARTEMLRAYRETSRAIYDQNSDLIKGYIWTARTTARTCAVCWAMHGTFHKTDKPFGTHPNCRCVMIPFMGGKNPVTLGPTVFKNLPEEKQLKILGPGKLELYKQGVPLKYAVGFKNHPTWGPVRYERSIESMKSKVAIAGALGEDKLPAGTHKAAVAAAKAKLAGSPAIDDAVDISKINFDHTPATPKAKLPDVDPNLGAAQAIDPAITSSEHLKAIDAELGGPEKTAHALLLIKKIQTGEIQISQLNLEQVKLLNDYDKVKVKTAASIGKPAPSIEDLLNDIAPEHVDAAVADLDPIVDLPEPPAARTYVVDKQKKFEPKPKAKKELPKHPPDLDHALLEANDLLTDATPWGSGSAGGFGSVVFDDDGRVMIRRNKGDYQGIRWTWAKVNTAGSPVATSLDATKKKLGVDGQITGFVPGNYKSNVRYFMMRAKSTTKPPDSNTEEVRWVSIDEAKKLFMESTDVAGRDRDLAVLDAAAKERKELLAGKDPWKPPPPPPPPPPAPWERPPVKAAKYKAPARPDDFPEDPANLRVVSKLGGSTGAELVEDPATGKKYVRKRGNSAEHVREEFVADEIYRSLGVPVPRAHLYESKSGPVKIAEYIEGTTLDKLNPHGTDYLAATDKLKEHLAIDALLGNYDVVGMSLDNILVAKDGTVYRIDNGGSLRYRAQGALKDRWDDHVSTLWTMRGETVLDDDKTQDAATRVFKDLGAYKLRRQIDKISETAEKKMLAAVPDELRDNLQRRLRSMRDVARYWKDLEADDWVEDYADTIGKHVVGLRAANVTHTLPKKFKADSYNKMTDETGKHNDHFETMIKNLDGYMKKKGTDLDHVARWVEAQAGHSWAEENVAFKKFLSDQIKLKKGEEYWHDHKKKEAENALSRKDAKAYREAQAIYKATVLEVFSRVEIPNVDRAAGTIRLIRSENSSILPKYGITPGVHGDNLEIKRGLSESYSLISPVTVHGSEFTLQEIPYTRVNGAYFLASRSGRNYSFCGDGENEISAIWRSSKDRTNYVPRSKVKK